MLVDSSQGAAAKCEVGCHTEAARLVAASDPLKGVALLLASLSLSLSLCLT